MLIFKLLAGIAFFALGAVYLFRPDIVLTLNRISREILFNDRIILLKRKNLAILFFCLSFIALYMGFSSLSNLMSSQNKISRVNLGYLMYLGTQEYCAGKYAKALEKFQRVLIADPDNHNALKISGYSYLALGNKNKAVELLRSFLKFEPYDNDVKQIIKDTEEKK